MKLFYLHNIAMPGPEANTVNVAKMCSAFAANGCDVTLAALPGAPSKALHQAIHDHYDLSENFDILALPRAASRPTLAATLGVAMAVRRQSDIFYTRAPHAALAACLTGLPTILEVHTDLGAFSQLGRAALTRAAQHPLLRAIVVISEPLAELLGAQLPQPRAPLVVAHDGADPAPPHPQPRNERLTAGFVGRFYRGRGLDLIAKTAALCPWADFHIIGGDNAGAAQCAGLPMPPNVTCHGAAPHRDVAKLMQHWDIALAPYQRSVIVADGKTDTAKWMSPLKVFEYMASGKTIFASDLPAIREILSDQTAMLLPPDDPNAWAAALQEMRDDPAKRASLAERAEALFLAAHTWKARAGFILDRAGVSAPRFAQTG